MKNLFFSFVVLLLGVFTSTQTQAQTITSMQPEQVAGMIYDFKVGVNIPAGVTAELSVTPTETNYFGPQSVTVNSGSSSETIRIYITPIAGQSHYQIEAKLEGSNGVIYRSIIIIFP